MYPCLDAINSDADSFNAVHLETGLSADSNREHTVYIDHTEQFSSGNVLGLLGSKNVGFESERQWWQWMVQHFNL